MATRLRDLDPEDGPRRPALLHALAALETVETAVEDPKRLASSLVAVRGALAVLKAAVREEAHQPAVPRTREAPDDGGDDLAALEDVLGRSPAWQKVLAIVARVADTPVTALLEGESGTGKELLARVIHRSSKLAGRTFVAVNCGALPGPLLEAELFGHTKGAFTGAVTERKGRFKEADNKGTLFLDEIGEIPFDVQAKLLRALQSGEIQRLGQDKVERVNVRVLAATNRDLPRMSREGKFREDLFYRLAAIRVILPPLRERSEEILPLLAHFLERYARAYVRPTPVLSSAAQRALVAYRFPGNIRELENVAKHLVLLSASEEAGLDDLPASIREGANAASPLERTPLDHDDLLLAKKEASARLERAFVVAALARAGGNVSKAARDTGMNRAYLQRLVQEHVPET